MLGYVFVVIVIFCLVVFTYQHLRRFIVESKKQEATIRGYYLVSHTYEETNGQSRYYGVFQQGNQEITLELTLQLYLQIKPPLRGELVAQDGKVQSFLP